MKPPFVADVLVRPPLRDCDLPLSVKKPSALETVRARLQTKRVEHLVALVSRQAENLLEKSTGKPILNEIFGSNPDVIEPAAPRVAEPAFSPKALI